MTQIQIPAACVRQGDLLLYTTALKVKDLASENFYNVETLDTAGGNDAGYQRVLNPARARKLADYIIKGQDKRDAFLPTSVFLATDKSIDFNEADHTISFDTAVVGPFSVVDGPRLRPTRRKLVELSYFTGLKAPIQTRLSAHG